MTDERKPLWPWTAIVDTLIRGAKPAENLGESPIGALFDRVGSDKGRWYGRLYDMLIEPVRDSVKCVIEVGIGTMLPTAPSSMRDWAGKNYRPGASLRVWRDYFQSAQIHGIDPAADTAVVGEERITTHHFDSRDAARAADLFERFKLVPDLVIDDGLHTAEAQVATMRNFLPHVKPGGLYIVEDVMPKDVKPVSAAIEQIRPGCIYVPDMRPEPWIAIAIRTPR
jgi:hypothetical protein